MKETRKRRLESWNKWKKNVVFLDIFHFNIKCTYNLLLKCIIYIKWWKKNDFEKLKRSLYPFVLSDSTWKTMNKTCKIFFYIAYRLMSISNDAILQNLCFLIFLLLTSSGITYAIRNKDKVMLIFTRDVHWSCDEYREICYVIFSMFASPVRLTSLILFTK